MALKSIRNIVFEKNPTRIVLRYRLRQIIFFFQIAFTQWCVGVTNQIVNDVEYFYIFWDMDYCTIEQCIETLLNVQEKYNLAHIYISADNQPNSFRAWCFSRVDFKTYMKILLDTRFVDIQFISDTFSKGYSTLRTSAKIGRIFQEIICVLETYYQQIPYDEQLFRKRYATGLSKRTTKIFIGE